MATEVGAETFEEMHEMGCAGKWYPLNLHYFAYLTDAPYTGIFVDDAGKRRIDEDGPNYIVHAKFFQDDIDHYWAIYDQNILELSETLERVNTGLKEYPDKYFTADTIEELAQAAGIDAAGLQTTVTAYNTMAANGVDTDFGKLPENLIALENGPYYAVYTQQVSIGTLGGVKTNIDAQVLDGQGTPIAGLFAAGEVSNRSFFNVSYLGGYALSIDVAQGKTAGELAAASV